MATPAHELLRIEAGRLKTANDDFVRAQYAAAAAEARKNAATVAQMLALENAFEALKTAEKRDNYVAAYKAKTVKDNSVQKDTATYVIASENTPALKKAYAEFVSKNYKSEPDYQRFRPEEYSFNNPKEFQASPIYNKISTDQRDNIVKAGFPSKFLAFRFKNQQDADKFCNDMRAKGLIQEVQPSTSPRMSR